MKNDRAMMMNSVGIAPPRRRRKKLSKGFESAEGGPPALGRQPAPCA
jgi:hypothetical protein